jgi:hypothetical protein
MISLKSILEGESNVDKFTFKPKMTWNRNNLQIQIQQYLSLLLNNSKRHFPDYSRKSNQKETPALKQGFFNIKYIIGYC